MASYKVLDADQLDADLGIVADAIRTKGGTSADLAFPDGFVSAVENIETGGGAEDLNAVLTEQEALIAELQDTLRGKAAGGGEVVEPVIKPLEVTENGTYTAPDGVDGYSPVTVNVPIPDGYIVPSGTKTITENGTHDAREFESVDVNVPIPDGYIKPSGELEVTENGTHDVTQYASVEVNVPTGGGGGDLPAGYSRVDYIQFDGTQTVDTGIICNQNTKIQLAFTRERSTQHYLYGVASSDNTASVTAYMGGSWRFGNKSVSKVPTTNADMIYSGLVHKTTVTITGSASAISGVNEFETVGSLLLGACRNSNGTLGASQFIGKIFFFAISQGEEQVQKLVPVTDGTVFRFYDMLSGAFFDSITDTPLSGGNL